MFNKKTVGLVSAIILCGATVGTVANAGTTVPFTFLNAGNSDTIDISSSGGAPFEDVYAGLYEGDLNGTDIGIFCTTPVLNVSNGQSYQADVDYGVTDGVGVSNGTYYQGGLASSPGINDMDASYPVGTTNAEKAVINSERADEVGYLVDTYYGASGSTFATLGSGSTDYSTNMAAIATSIWDIEEDGGDGINDGKFVSDGGGNSTYGSLVDFYENEASPYDTTTFDEVRWIQAPIGSNTQSFAYVLPGSNSIVQPVPEASSLVLFASLLAGMGLMLRGRRKSQAAKVEIR